jgi:uncharacterized protein
MDKHRPANRGRASAPILRRAGMLIWALSILFAGVPAEARNSTLAAAQKTCLWSVDLDDSRLFLLGSIHFMRPDAYPLPPAMDAAYAESRVIVFETDISGMQDPRIQARMLELGTYPQGQSLFSDLSPDTGRQLKQKLGESGLPADVVAGLRPWLVALTLSSLEFMRLGFDPNLGVDMHFHRQASQDGKKITALETVEHQLQILAGMNGRDQERFLAQTLQELDQAPRLASDMSALWRTGQTAELHRLLFQSIDRHPEIRDRMLNQRNQAWVQKIEDLIRRRETALVIVGTMHLIGPGSLIDLLRERGYRVEQH